MTDVKPPSREERLKAALRENLKRRKAQARGRARDRTEPDGVEERGAAPPPEEPAG